MYREVTETRNPRHTQKTFESIYSKRACSLLLLFLGTMNRFVFGLHFTLFGLLLSVNYSISSKSVDCHTNLTSIAFAEYDVKDLSVHRTYILCPNTTFDAASLNSEYSFTEKHALFIRSNVLVLCGQDGSSDNSCVINGNGDYGIVIDPLLWGYNESFVENVTIQGVTVDYFSGNEEYSVFPVSIGLESGDVTFKDCIFSNNFNVPLFDIAQYIVPSKRLLREGDTETVERELQSNVKITFDSCKFDVSQITQILYSPFCICRFSSFILFDRGIKAPKNQGHQVVYHCYPFQVAIFQHLTNYRVP